ncbi:unnamed protein product, partial [Mesorhabditis belari]|uniref:Uncharacterized protein n=1 Tax=Mesorhabditis belari TaxID=2138241 RepID=A0AAF3F2R2_9BILA
MYTHNCHLLPPPPPPPPSGEGRRGKRKREDDGVRPDRESKCGNDDAGTNQGGGGSKKAISQYIIDATHGHDVSVTGKRKREDEDSVWAARIVTSAENQGETAMSHKN